jgi:hypothetical protein
MKVYSFVKISDNRNPRDFCIDITSMRDARHRMSALRSQYGYYLDDLKGWHPIFHWLERDYSFYVLEKRRCDNYQEAKAHRQSLMEWQREKLSLNMGGKGGSR